MGFSLWSGDDVERFVTLYSKKGKQSDKDLGKITACVKTAVNGYNELIPDNRLYLTLHIRRGKSKATLRKRKEQNSSANARTMKCRPATTSISI